MRAQTTDNERCKALIVELLGLPKMTNVLGHYEKNISAMAQTIAPAQSQTKWDSQVPHQPTNLCFTPNARINGTSTSTSHGTGTGTPIPQHIRPLSGHSEAVALYCGLELK
ncbi:hypothetical protein B0H65DRAFT_548733 [Neurospora tetraspora]|uniref:Uncharacterized protein n=1 Tax=Neurospora tetraspora TaxID=94610 RepID=A0AAE0JF78_9PEZI|nr:hypothetical protein B0H65DRAFT_548733 [Neurospora tetraspora]